MNVGQNEERFWVEDGCVFQNHEHDGSWQPKSFEAGVRCCSNTNNGKPCYTPFHCGNKMTLGDAVATCADNDQRLCTKKEMLDRRCCGTGGDCDGYLVWTSTPHPNNTGTGYSLHFFTSSPIMKKHK